MSKSRKRKHQNGVPAHLRQPEFTKVKCGRLSIMEYDVIDSMRRHGARTAFSIASDINSTEDATIRLLNRMVNCGLIKGSPVDVRYTAVGLAFYLEADRWMLDPKTRPVKPPRPKRRQPQPQADQLRMC